MALWPNSVREVHASPARASPLERTSPPWRTGSQFINCLYFLIRRRLLRQRLLRHRTWTPPLDAIDCVTAYLMLLEE